MSQLILENSQAVGDALMFTCAVRDLHKQFPNEFITELALKVPDIVKYNPHNGHVNRELANRHIRVGYSNAINQSNSRSAHFGSGFVQELSEKMGMRIHLTDIRPDVYLSAEEKDPRNRAIKEPYWVMIAGGKRDFTTKIWDPIYYQKVANNLYKDFRVVQLGAAQHIHPNLANVTNMVGKTNIRQMLQLIYHSLGVICPITGAMHMAAAFNKPCVVIAGGREPWWWEAYTTKTWAANINKPCPTDFMPHAYLHTIGQLPCCKTVGCWRNGVSEQGACKNCTSVVSGPSIRQPKCMSAITPEMVTEAVRIYMNGGKPVEDAIPTFLKPPLFTEAINPIRMPYVVTPAKRPPNDLRRALRGGKVSKARFLGRYRGIPRSGPTAQPGAAFSAPRPITASPVVSRPSPIGMSRGAPQVVVAKGLNCKPWAGPLVSIKSLTICVLLYGDYLPLAQRCLRSIYQAVDKSLFELRLGANAISQRTRDWIKKEILPYGNVRFYDSIENLRKYPIMRKMLYDEPAAATEWTAWFDDDSSINDASWLPQLDNYVRCNAAVGMIGKQYFYHLKPGQVDWIKQAKWYTGKPMPLRKGIPKSDFMTGGYWLIKTEHLKTLNWPDPRLGHNSGDVNLGAACYQNNIALGQFYNGVTISGAPRRGISEKHPGR